MHPKEILQRANYDCGYCNSGYSFDIFYEEFFGAENSIVLFEQLFFHFFPKLQLLSCKRKKKIMKQGGNFYNCPLIYCDFI